MVTTGEEQVAARPAVALDGGKVVIRELVIDDHDLVEYLAAVEDPTLAIVEALRVGVRVLRIAATSGDVEMVKHQFDAMTTAVQTNVDKLLQGAEGGLRERLMKFTAEDLKGSLDAHRGELNKELVKLFGLESASSVQRQIDKMLEEQAKLYKQGLAAVLERTDDPENPLAKLREEMKAKADEAVKEIRELRDKVLEVAGGAKAAQAERQKGTAKGRTYQQYVYEEVERIAAAFGDIAEYVADQTGQRGNSKAGDVVVQLNPAEAAGSTLRVVFEAKNRAGISVNSILSELEDAKENRQALAAVAVFSAGEHVPSGLRTWRDYPGHRYVCVLDEDQPEPLMLGFAYRCARVDALTSIEVSEPKLDIAALKNVIKQLKARVAQFQQMRTSLGGAKDAIVNVQLLIEKHQDEMRRDFDEVDRLLSMRQEGEAP